MGHSKMIDGIDNPSTFFEKNVINPNSKLEFGAQETSFLRKKAGHLYLIGSSFFWSIIDTISGIGTTVKSIFTQNDDAWIRANQKTKSSRMIVAYPHLQVLYVLNGNLKTTKSMEGDGLFTHYVQSLLIKTLAQGTFRDSNYLFLKHVASRLTFAIAAIACIVARVADAVIGALAAVLSIATFGRVEILNAAAYRGLQFTGIIHDLSYLTTKIINPWAGGQGR